MRWLKYYPHGLGFSWLTLTWVPDQLCGKRPQLLGWRMNVSASIHGFWACIIEEGLGLGILIHSFICYPSWVFINIIIFIIIVIYAHVANSKDAEGRAEKKKPEITEKDHLKRRVTFRCGRDDIGGNRMKLVSYKIESERPGVQPSGDWQEPRRKRKGHWSWDKWFGNKEQKREQVWEKMPDSIEERAWAEHTVLMGMTLVRRQRGPQHHQAV